MTLKELLAKLAAAKATGATALKALNALVAKADPTAADVAQIATLETALVGLETEVEALVAGVATPEAAKRRGTLFAAAATTAYGAGARVRGGVDPDANQGFHSMAEFGLAVRNASYGQIDQRLAPAPLEANAPSSFNQNQGAGAEGYLVPPDWSRTVWDLALDQTDLLAMANPEPTASNAIGKPKDETTPWGSSGVQAYWAAEAAQLTPSTVAVSGELMTLHKLFAFVGVTDELLADAPMLQNRLTYQSGRAIGWTASDAVMWGNGAGKPTGFMTSPALITVAKDAGQATGTITVSNLAKMLGHVLRIGGKPVWIANQDIISQLVQLQIGNMPVYIPFNQGLQDNPFDGYLLGYPIMFTEHAQTLGTAGDITCANMAGYYAATKQGGIDFASSMHLYFDQGITAFRWTFRIAGQPLLSKPVQPARGSTTKSHFVALASRP